MLLGNWEKVVVAWANSLNLAGTKVNSVHGLVEGNFVPEILKNMGRHVCVSSVSREDNLKLIADFLKEEFERLELDDSWQNEEILLAVSLILLSGSLQSHDLRSPLFELNRSIQLVIQSFLQAFINVPRNVVDRQLVLNSLVELTSDMDDEVVSSLEVVNEGEGEGLAVSPRFAIDSSRAESPGSLCRRVTVLRSQNQILNLEKQHLVDEIESLKEDHEKLRTHYEAKVQEVLKLDNELCIVKDLLQSEAHDDSKLQIEEVAALKIQINDSEGLIRALRAQLDAEQSTVERLTSSLNVAERGRIELKSKLEGYESRCLTLQRTVEDLTCMTEALKKTCVEQSRLLTDYSTGGGHPGINDNVSNDSFVCGEGEALDHVIDLKCAELEEELIQTREGLASSKTRVDELTAELKEMNCIVDELRNEVRSRDAELMELRGKNSSCGENACSEEQKEKEMLFKLSNLLVTTLKKFGAVGELEPAQETWDGIFRLLNKLEDEVDRCRRLTSINDTLRSDLTNKHRELEVTLKSLTRSRQEVQKLEVEISDLRGDLRVRGTNMVALEQQVNMCEHEKAIFQRKIDLLKVDVDKLASMQSELDHWQERAIQAEKDLTAERLAARRLRNDIEIEEKLNVNFDSKLVQLQQKMKSQYEKELNRAAEDYSEKINQLKRKMLKDKAKIEELSTDLWDTSDKYLLASQESKALRAQLRRAEFTIKKLALNGGALPDEGQAADRSHLFLWHPPEKQMEDRVIVRSERWSFGGEISEGAGHRASLWSVPSVPIFARLPDSCAAVDDAEEEKFGEAFLDDLKAGIIRLPSGGAGECRRRTFDQSTLRSESGEKNADKSSGYETPLPPLPEKPKRKSQIVYSRPGPPTPSRSGRLSLQNNVSGPKATELHSTVQPLTITHHHKRLSKIFGTKAIPSTNLDAEVKPLPEPTPKSKRKSFFLRKFGNNRENIPPH